MDTNHEHGTASNLPQAPVLVQVQRGGFVESQHRGSWVITDTSGGVLDGAGDGNWPHFARSAIKSLQALPLLESGAADRFRFSPSDLALALSSHNGEARHTDGVSGILERLELGESQLKCGSQRPDDPEVRRRLLLEGQLPTALHNNCSGKHAGFLALSRHLGEGPEHYLEPDSEVQTVVRGAVAQMTDLDPEGLTYGVDGCSAPTYRLSLEELAVAFARVANPEGLNPERSGACLRMTEAVAAHPLMLAGEHKRLCSELARVTQGRLFPKVGAEAIYGVGEVGGGRGFAIKFEDGSFRAFYAAVVGLLHRHGFLSTSEYAELSHWLESPLKNWAGLEVGRLQLI